MLRVFWFEGSRESGPDVQIAESSYSRTRNEWSPAEYVANREASGRALGFAIRRFGNPAAWKDARGRTHLFVVATGLGGWAASRVLHLREDVEEQGFQTKRVLPLSWLWNLSHLVRAAPLPLADGGMILPIYFELGKKYPVALRFDADGDFRGVIRMSRRSDRLQPTVVALTEKHWLALMRDSGSGRRVHAAHTTDGGKTWRDLPDTHLANPDASVAALALSPEKLLLAHNPQRDGRASLVLSESREGVNWADLSGIASGAQRTEYFYPAMAWVDNSLWVTYTDRREAIAWKRFSFGGQRP